MRGYQLLPCRLLNCGFLSCSCRHNITLATCFFRCEGQILFICAQTCWCGAGVKIYSINRIITCAQAFNRTTKKDKAAFGRYIQTSVALAGTCFQLHASLAHNKKSQVCRRSIRACSPAQDDVDGTLPGGFGGPADPRCPGDCRSHAARCDGTAGN